MEPGTFAAATPPSDMRPLQDVQTRERLLLAAERLFAEQGYGAVSLRTIMADAHANMASAHYYFGSKEGVLEAIFNRHGTAMNQERDALFDAYEREPGTGEAAARRIIGAFIGPAIRLRDSPDGPLFDRISAICSVDPNPKVRDIVFRTFDAVGKRFSRLLRAALPELSDEEYYWRLHCLFGSMMYVRANNGRVDHLTAQHRQLPAGFVLEQLVRFTAAGMCADGADAAPPDPR